ncbi:MAG: hypothetical protein ACRD2J_17215 [Thermoanaerobaculia bacterium]
MTDDPIRDDYFLEIESHFAARRGTPFVFSAKDWALMKSWREEGVPLAVVIEAIDTCFAKREEGGRRRTISSLSYCRHAVRDMWDERKELQVGGAGGVPERDTGAMLAELAERVEGAASGAPNEAVRRVLADVAAAVRAVPADSVPRVEDALMRIEEGLIDGLLGALSADELRELQDEVDASLASHRLEGTAAERTRAANLRRLVRKRFAVPRLSLFT